MTKQDLITVVGSKTGQNDSHVRPIIEATKVNGFLALYAFLNCV